MVLDDGTVKIDAVGFYTNHEEFQDVYSNLQVNNWYKIRTVDVELSKKGFKRETSHKYEIIIKSGTTIVPASAFS